MTAAVAKLQDAERALTRRKTLFRAARLLEELAALKRDPTERQDIRAVGQALREMGEDRDDG